MRSIKGDNMKMWKGYKVYINDHLMVEGMAPTTLQDGTNTRWQRLAQIMLNTHYGEAESMEMRNGVIILKRIL